MKTIPDRYDADGEVHTERSDLLWAAWESLSEKDQDWLGYDGLAELIEWRADHRKLRWIYAQGEPFWGLRQRGDPSPEAAADRWLPNEGRTPRRWLAVVTTSGVGDRPLAPSRHGRRRPGTPHTVGARARCAN